LPIQAINSKESSLSIVKETSEPVSPIKKENFDNSPTFNIEVKNMNQNVFITDTSLAQKPDKPQLKSKKTPIKPKQKEEEFYEPDLKLPLDLICDTPIKGQNTDKKAVYYKSKTPNVSKRIFEKSKFNKKFAETSRDKFGDQHVKVTMLEIGLQGIKSKTQPPSPISGSRPCAVNKKYEDFTINNDAFPIRLLTRSVMLMKAKTAKNRIKSEQLSKSKNTQKPQIVMPAEDFESALRKILASSQDSDSPLVKFSNPNFDSEVKMANVQTDFPSEAPNKNTDNSQSKNLPEKVQISQAIKLHNLGEKEWSPVKCITRTQKRTIKYSKSQQNSPKNLFISGVLAKQYENTEKIKSEPQCEPIKEKYTTPDMKVQEKYTTLASKKIMIPHPAECEKSINSLEFENNASFNNSPQTAKKPGFVEKIKQRNIEFQNNQIDEKHEKYENYVENPIDLMSNTQKALKVHEILQKVKEKSPITRINSNERRASENIQTPQKSKSPNIRKIIAPFKQLIREKSIKKDAPQVNTKKYRPKIKVLLNSDSKNYYSNAETVLRKSKIGDFTNTNQANIMIANQDKNFEYFMHYALLAAKILLEYNEICEKTNIIEARKMAQRFGTNFDNFKDNWLFCLVLTITIPDAEFFKEKNLYELQIGKHPADLYLILALYIANMKKIRANIELELCMLPEKEDIYEEFKRAITLLREYKVKEYIDRKMESVNYEKINKKVLSTNYNEKINEDLIRYNNSRNISLRDLVNKQKSLSFVQKMRKSVSVRKLPRIITKNRGSVAE